MTDAHPQLLVTGASGKLGHRVIEALLRTGPAARIVAGLRKTDDEAAAALRARGVAVRVVDYDRPETLAPALEGVARLLLISSDALGKRVGQHWNVIDAAREAGVGLLAYTSILHADTAPPAIADEHRRTEAALQASGVPFVVLRNGWYTENYVAAMPLALQHGAVLGSAGEGRISSAARADYAEAAAAVLTAPEVESGRIYELAGDEAFTLSAFAAEVSKVSGQAVSYRNLSEADYRAVLLQARLPEDLAGFVAAADAAAADGALFDDGRDLSRLIGRPTTPMPATVAAGKH